MTLRRMHWTLYFLTWVAGLTGAGALVGAISFPLLGLVFDWKFTSVQLAINGARNLGFLLFVWAVPIAAIACVIRAHRRRTTEPVPSSRS
jgi:hypothetical protein